MFLSSFFFFSLIVQHFCFVALARQRRKGSADKDLAPSLPRLSSSLLGKLSGTTRSVDVLTSYIAAILAHAWRIPPIPNQGIAEAWWKQKSSISICIRALKRWNKHDPPLLYSRAQILRSFPTRIGFPSYSGRVKLLYADKGRYY